MPLEIGHGDVRDDKIDRKIKPHYQADRGPAVSCCQHAAPVLVQRISQARSDAFIAFDNKSVNDDFTTVPIQIYNWTTRPQIAFQQNAAAGIIVLMVMVLTLNLIAFFIRERYRRK